MTVELVTLDEDLFKQALPKGMQKRVDTELLDSINGVLANSEEAEFLRDNMIGFTSVLSQGKFKVNDYVNAVKFVSYRMGGDNAHSAYVKTFPDKYKTWVKKGMSDKDMSSYVSMYSRGKLVQLIYEQSLIPSHVLNNDIFQEAINIQIAIARDPRSGAKVRSDAANSLMTHLKAPVTKKVELDVAVKQSSAVEDLHATMRQHAEMQLNQIATGEINAREAAHSDIIQGECVEVED